MTPRQPIPAHMTPQPYQIQYGQSPQQQRDQLPTYAPQANMRPAVSTYSNYGQIQHQPPLHSNGHYQHPYHIAPMPTGMPRLPGAPVTIPPPNAGLKPKPKQAKAKSRAPRISKVTKPKLAKPRKEKSRPQASKHLTPALRAAIITLKVTQTGMSFKEIGEILAMPPDSDDEDGDDDEEDEEADLVVMHSAPEVSTADPGPDRVIESATMTNGEPVAQFNSPQGVSPTCANQSMPEGSAPNQSIEASRPGKPKKKISSKKPIPRNTVAGIFKRAVNRAGTDSDIYKLLAQTGRREGSGRPKKGEERASSTAEQAKTLPSVREGVNESQETSTAQAVVPENDSSKERADSNNNVVWTDPLSNLMNGRNPISGPEVVDIDTQLAMQLGGNDTQHNGINHEDSLHLQDMDMDELEIDDDNGPDNWGTDDDEEHDERNQQDDVES